jgi:hypothetical protein
MRCFLLKSAIVFLLFFSLKTVAQPRLESLDRGLVAVRTSPTSVFLSWRFLGTDPDGVTFNVYRDDVRVNDLPLNGATNYVDEVSGDFAYSVNAVIDGVEQPSDAAVPVLANNWFDIPLSVPDGGETPDGVNYTYSPNDLSVGDIDGDGEYEIIVKWDPSNSKDNSLDGYTGNVYLDAYKMDGTHFWRIDLGVNIRAGAHYTQFLVYDFDGDGLAEVVCKTAPGTIDGAGNALAMGPAASANHGADYRNDKGYILSGPEYLTVFNGLTGAEMATVNYVPGRGNVSDWGDSYGNRADRFLAGVAYLDGKNPSIVMTRGYYTRSVLAAWDWKDGALTPRWVFDSNNAGNSAYAGQGNHQLSVADVDGDGMDEIIFGSCTINNDGTGLYSTGLGHGDALHVSDLIPSREGLEVFMPHETGGNGVTLRDAATGEIIWQKKKEGVDIGRGLSADIMAEHPGNEFWASSGLGVYDIHGNIVGSIPSVNHAIWWDGDLLRELLDGTTISKYKGATLLSATGCSSNNWTKKNPGIQADLFGDWREEVIFRTSDNTKLRVFTTNIPTIYRLPALMHDAQYRTAIAWQNVSYNQPPHVSYFLGHGMEFKFRQSFLRYPVSITADNIEVYALSLKWQNLEDTADEIVIEMSENNTDFIEVARVDAQLMTADFKDLSSGTDYHFRLKTLTTDRESDYSAVLTVRTVEEPMAPLDSKLLLPVNGSEAVNYSNVFFSWENGTNLMAGTVYYSVFLGTSAEALVLVEDELTNPSWTVSRLEPGTNYFWQVKAENALGTSLSEVEKFTTAQLEDRTLLLHIPFDETSGSETMDLVSNTKAQASGFTPQWQSGPLNNSVFFWATPATSHMYFPHNAGIHLDDQSFTISLWFKSPGNIADSYLLHKGMHDAANGGNGKWMGLQYKGTKLTFAVDDNVNKTNIDIADADQWFDNQWHHLVTIRNKAEGKLQVFVNGGLQGERNDLTSNGIGVTTDLILGNCDGYFNTPFAGNMDELRIYNEALTPGEVEDLYLNTAISLKDVVTLSPPNDVVVFPNPFTDHLKFKLSDHWLTNKVNVSVYDLAGRLLMLETLEVIGGQFQMDGLGFLAKGMYTFVIHNNARMVAVKMMH